jgi:hypothetical protein
LSGRSAAGLSTVELLGDREMGDRSRWIRTECWTLFVNLDIHIPYQVRNHNHVNGLICSNSDTVPRQPSRVRALFNWRINSINRGVSTTRCMALGSALKGKGYGTGGGSGCGSCCRICCRNMERERRRWVDMVVELWKQRRRRQWRRESGVREVRDDVKNFGVSDWEGPKARA